MDKNNKMHSADFNRANTVSINGWEHTWVKKRKKKNTFTLILQREGLRMYLCLINGGGGGIFAVNKLGVISQRYLPDKLTISPHRDTTQRLRAHKGKTPTRPVCSHTFSAVYICCCVGGACFHEPHTITNCAGSCDDKH